MTSELLRQKWETDAREHPVTPQEERQLDKNRKAPAETQKVNPMTAHALHIGEPISLTPTEREALRAALRASLEKREQRDRRAPVPAPVQVETETHPAAETGVEGPAAERTA